VQQNKFIVWNESTMAHKKILEALDRTLQYFRKNKNRFGGAMILLAGDFCQTLPRSTPADELNVCLNSSVLWKDVKTPKLNMNLYVVLHDDQSGKVLFQTIARYWQWQNTC